MIKELYGDLSEADFNKIFKTNGENITKKYGKTLDITLTVNRTILEDGRVAFQTNRAVKEDMTKMSFMDDITESNKVSQEDPHLACIK